MATTRTFNDLIKEYMPYDLHKEEVIKRDWFLSNSTMDESYKGGTLYVPFQGQKASTIQKGVYADTSKIKQSKNVKAKITGYKETWGSMIFNDSDLQEHGDLEKSFLKILPDELDQFNRSMKETISREFLNGPWICRLTATSVSAAGIVLVDRPERLEVGMQLVIEEYAASFPTVSHSVGNASASVGYTEAYVKSINMNTKEVVIADAAGVALSFAAVGEDLTVGANPVRDQPRIYLVNGEVVANQLLSLRYASLSAANGGSATLYGETKVNYPILQSLNFDGSTILTTNILDKLFDFHTAVKLIGKGNPQFVVMGEKAGKAVKKNLEVSRTYEAVDKKASPYGWEVISIGGSKGMLDVVIVNEMDDDIIHIVDKSSWKIFSNGMFRRRKDPGDGKEYFTVRGATGFQYVVDIAFFGDMVVHAPSYNGIVYDVNLP